MLKYQRGPQQGRLQRLQFERPCLPAGGDDHLLQPRNFAGNVALGHANRFLTSWAVSGTTAGCCRQMARVASGEWRNSCRNS